MIRTSLTQNVCFGKPILIGEQAGGRRANSSLFRELPVEFAKPVKSSMKRIKFDATPE